MVDNKDGTFTLTEAELIELLNNTRAAQEFISDIYLLRDNVMKVCAAFKITTKDGKRIRKSILDKTENPIMSLCKGGIETLGLMTSASIGMKSAEREIEEKFGFLASLGPLLQKYGTVGEQLLELGWNQKQLGSGAPPEKVITQDTNFIDITKNGKH